MYQSAHFGEFLFLFLCPQVPSSRSLAPDSEENLERIYGTQWKHTVPDLPYRYLNPKP